MDYVNEGPVDFSGDETPLHEVENFHDSVPHLDKKFFYTDSKYFSMVDSVRNNSEFVCPDGYHLILNFYYLIVNNYIFFY